MAVSKNEALLLERPGGALLSKHPSLVALLLLKLVPVASNMSSSVASRSLQLLLFLTASGFSDAGSSSTLAADTLTTETLSQESTSDDEILHQRTSTTDPPRASQAPILPQMKDNITISGFPKDSLVKDTILESPAELELLCSLAIKPSMEMEKMEVAWRMGNETIKEDILYRNQTKTSWCTRYEIRVETKDQMASYTCVYKTEPEINATFHLQVPEVHGKSKQIVSYVADFVVLTCVVGNETSRYFSSSWVWYTKNGSEQVAINATLMSEKYSIVQEYYNTSLKILDLLEEDTSVYMCEAIFPLGESSGEVSLKVLTYITPLKPFLAIVAEVIVFVAIIFIYEACSKKKETPDEVEKEFDQEETLRTEDTNGVENSTTRHRKV
ncbi:embigin [Rhineura floridana]|uniref:embigin n=1 Tax=Rhineura floridana TaxID=261503 RepID=UPI002AC8107D|nr:embigin [Rhineura floridana]